MISMTPGYLADVMATVYRRRVREELAFARQARAWGLTYSAGFHLQLALFWRTLAVDWRRFARRHR